MLGIFAEKNVMNYEAEETPDHTGGFYAGQPEGLKRRRNPRTRATVYLQVRDSEIKEGL